MIFRRKQEIRLEKLSVGEKNEALEIMASEPMKKYLYALMDELIRQGLYLDEKKREGAKFTIELLSEQIKKGETILFKKRKRAGASE